MSDQHWHGLIGTHLDREAVHLNATHPMPTAHEARDMIVQAVKLLAETMPFIAPLADEMASVPAEDCHAILLTAGFTVLPCAGSEESECMKTVDREAEEMVKAYEVKQVMRAMSASPDGLPPEYQQITEEFVTGVGDRVLEGPEPGFYL